MRQNLKYSNILEVYIVFNNDIFNSDRVKIISHFLTPMSDCSCVIGWHITKQALIKVSKMMEN